MRLRVLLLLACLSSTSSYRVAASADGAPGRVRMSTNRTRYRAADPVIVTTVNRGGHALYDDHCAGVVEGFDYRQGWNASYGTGRTCLWPDPAAWRTYSVAIAPGAAHRDTFVINPQSYTGTWHVVLGLRDAAGRVLAESLRTSNTFHVARR